MSFFRPCGALCDVNKPLAVSLYSWLFDGFPHGAWLHIAMGTLYYYCDFAWEGASFGTVPIAVPMGSTMGFLRTAAGALLGIVLLVMAVSMATDLLL